jgi:hypothetical protein
MATESGIRVAFCPQRRHNGRRRGLDNRSQSALIVGGCRPLAVATEGSMIVDGFRLGGHVAAVTGAARGDRRGPAA